jgi:hypothetical protein
MIIVKITGGLGNQMFQYAVGRQLALKNNARLLLDTSGFEEYKLRKYSLDHFNLTVEIADKKTLESFYQYLQKKNYFKRFYNRFLKRPKIIYLIENNYEYKPNIINKYNGDIVLEGFWQSEKYFEEIKNIIQQEFTLKTMPEPKDKAVIDKIQSGNSVSIHIRRGDYVSNPTTFQYHGICSLDYYIEATKLIQSRIDNPQYFVFSDDIDWSKENLGFLPKANFVAHNSADKDYEDLRLMSLCKHQIIANSSFSWWAAWLNTNKSKIVIAPKTWVAYTGVETKDIVPESWIRL